MAHSLSAKKRIRQAEKRRARNRARKAILKDSLKSFTSAHASGDVAKTEAEFKSISSRLDKVAAKGTIHRNTASRKRSRLAKRLNALRAGITKPAAVKGASKKKTTGAGTKGAAAKG